MTVERLEREMSSAEFDEWVEFYKLEPFGNEEKMHDYRHASLMSCIQNMTGAKTKPKDFLMYGQKEEQLDVEDMTEEQIKEAQKTIFQIFTMG
ncbi:phage tail assembly protein T [Sulfurospirillum cavolei]|uniref:phage tail assembly protein T n=1 Tax=Sulfurospirillum cavolei TaxID=366522 RepID=UPI003FA1D9E6